MDCGVSFDRSSSSKNAIACLFSWNSSTRSSSSPFRTVCSSPLRRGSIIPIPININNINININIIIIIR